MTGPFHSKCEGGLSLSLLHLSLLLARNSDKVWKSGMTETPFLPPSFKQIPAAKVLLHILALKQSQIIFHNLFSSVFNLDVRDLLWILSCSPKTSMFGLIGSTKLSTGVSEKEFVFFSLWPSLL